jgi:SAM-dependent methyltransferase
MTAIVGDVVGLELADLLAGRRAFDIVERDDGHVVAYDARYLVAPFRHWDDPVERRAMRFVRGRVLDVGCGGGRACLHLQDRGLEVVGIDASAGAVDACRARGVRDVRRLAIQDLDGALGRFDTVLFLGQNFGMVGSATGARRVLGRLAAVCTARGRIVAECYDPHRDADQVHVRYRAANVACGRMPGQLRVRLRYRHLRTPWHDWLQLAPGELAELASPHGWRLVRTLGDGPSYVAILERLPHQRGQTPGGARRPASELS